MKYVFALISILPVALSLFSCNSNAAENSMVAVWSSEDNAGIIRGPIAYGLVVGDGTQILTVFGDDEGVPQALFIGIPGKTKYPVAVKAIDANNHVALLQMSEKIFSPAAIPEEHEYLQGTTFVLHGWSIGDYTRMDRREIGFPVEGGSGMMKDGLGPYNDKPGALITTEDDEIIGLLGIRKPSSDPESILLGGPGITSPMVDIHDALLILERVE